MRRRSARLTDRRRSSATACARKNSSPVAPAPDAVDFLFIGALRDLKGPDLFIEAMAAFAGSAVAAAQTP